MAKTVKKASKSQSKKPLVSVVMSVYNGEKYLREAMDSILNQTYKNLEFIIIDDGSTDDTLKIIKTYKDPRIILITRENKGLVASLNEGIKKAKGSYIARQDADDISEVDRINRQVEYMKQRPNVGLVGSSIRIINERGDSRGVHYVYSESLDVKRELMIRSPFAHGSIMLNKNKLNRHDIYNSEYWPAEDYAVWSSLISDGVCAGNIHEALYRYRDNTEGISSSNPELQKNKSNIIRQSNLGNFEKLWSPVDWFKTEKSTALKKRMFTDMSYLIRELSCRGMCREAIIVAMNWLSSFFTRTPYTVLIEHARRYIGGVLHG